MSKRGFSPVIVVLAISLLALVPLANIKTTRPFSGPSVEGVLIAKGGDDSSGGSSGGGDSGGGSHDSGGSSGGSGGSSNNTSSALKVEKSEKVEKPEKIEVKFKVEKPEKKEKIENETENEVEDEIEQVEIKSSASGELEIETRKGKKSTTSGQLKLGKSEIKIKTEDGKLEFEFKGIGALTNFPLSFNKATNTLFVNTPNGPKPIRVLPDQAATAAQTAGVQNLIEKIELETTATGSAEPLAFKIKGKKIGNLLGLIPVSADVETEVGAETGQILTTTQPLWLRLFGSLVR